MRPVHKKHNYKVNLHSKKIKDNTFKQLVTAGLKSRCLDPYTPVLSTPSSMGVLKSLFEESFVLRCFQHLPLNA